MRSTRHETPSQVAALLAKWAPLHMETLLEPAVGNGALLRPMLSLLSRNRTTVVCVDVNRDCLNEFSAGIGKELQGRLQLMNSDFLEIDTKALLAGAHGFDCVVMNPPFSAKMRSNVRLREGCSGEGGVVRGVPIEMAFVHRAVNLLNPGGSLLTVLPASVVSSKKGAWVRQFLFEQGSVKYAHELPCDTFASVEAKIYLLVFRKSPSRNRRIMLCNHSLENPERILIDKRVIGDELRLDFAFHQSRSSYDRLKGLRLDVGWRPLSSVAEVRRGGIPTPLGIKTAIHSTDFCMGFWSGVRLNGGIAAGISDRSVGPHDLLMARVGRNCHMSVGPLAGEEEFYITDCMIRIRPRFGVDRIRLLFSLRCVLQWEVARDLIRRGGSAAYILPDNLAELDIPFDISHVMPFVFKSYTKAASAGDYARMNRIESFALARLLRIGRKKTLSE